MRLIILDFKNELIKKITEVMSVCYCPIAKFHRKLVKKSKLLEFLKNKKCIVNFFPFEIIFYQFAPFNLYQVFILN